MRDAWPAESYLESYGCDWPFDVFQNESEADYERAMGGPPEHDMWELILLRTELAKMRKEAADKAATKNGAIGRLDQRYNRWLGREVTMQTKLWVDIHGNVIPLDNMDKGYLLNVLCFLYEGHYGDITPPRRNPLVQALRERILG